MLVEIVPTETINKINSLCHKNSPQEIKQLFLETFAHRTSLRKNHGDATLILKLYQKFLYCDFLVSINIRDEIYIYKLIIIQ